MIGEEGRIYCSIDLMVDKIELIYAGEIMAVSNTQTIELVFRPVYELLYNREYVCKTTSSYGNQERRIILNVTGKPLSAIKCSHDEVTLVFQQYQIHQFKSLSVKVVHL